MSDARSYIDGLAARGRYHSPKEAREALGGTRNAVMLALDPRNDDKKHSSGYNRLPW